MIMNSAWITKQCLLENMIVPFAQQQTRLNGTQRIISYGLNGYGYDLRLSSNEFRIFHNTGGAIVDPKRFDAETLYSAPLHEDDTGAYFILPGHSYGLGVSLERLNIPLNTTVLFIGKSTYARCGLIVNMTPGENGWCGHLTIEISNSTPVDAKIYANEGICQALFFTGEKPTIVYDNSRKYQNQPEQVVPPKI